MSHTLAMFAIDRPERTEIERFEEARSQSSHLPPIVGVRCSSDDVLALQSAFIAKFDEDLPQTETLMAVALIGYRMAVRDLQSQKGSDDE